MIITFQNEDRAKVFAALFNNSRPFGRGVCQNAPNISVEEAEQMLQGDDEEFFDYVRGRLMKVWLRDTSVETRLYDRDFGENAALEALLEAEIEVDI